MVYHNLDTMITAIRVHLDAHNNTLLTGCDYSRRQQFEGLERDLLKPLNKYLYDPMTAKASTVNALIFINE